MPKLIKNILVPTDFTQSSVYALQAAIKFAKKISGQIYLFHQIDLPKGWDNMTEEEKDTFPDARKKEQEMQENFDKLMKEKKYAITHIHPIYSAGDFLTDAADLAKDYEIDLVVMGSDGADGMKEWLFGTNAQKMTNKVDVPVLVVKHDIGEFELKQVVFASEFKEDAKEPFIQLIDLLRNFGSHIHLLYVAPVEDFVVDEKILARMKEFEDLCWALPCYVHGRAEQTVELGIKFFMANARAELLCLVHHSKNPIEKLFKGSVSEKLINHLECPVLSLPAKRKELEGKSQIKHLGKG